MIAPARVSEPQPYRLALRADEAADALGISQRTLAAMVSADAIPHVYIGTRNLRFPVVALQAWLDAQTIMPAALVRTGHELNADSRDDLAGDTCPAANRAASGRAIDD